MGQWVGVATVAVRFLAPLFILRFPLPAILVCLVVDAADQTVFQALTDQPLDWYQAYDKALDVFYLSIAYISTMSAWPDERAFRLSRSLFYWRLIGAALFEITGWRFLLLIFPNAFEYFFVAYETIRTRWNPERLTAVALVGLAVAITLVIKVPQETWIHILQLDVTDVLGDHPALLIVVAALVVAAAVGGVAAVRRAPGADWAFTIDAHRHLPPRPPLGLYAQRLFDAILIEKLVFLTLIGVVLAHMLPGLNTPTWHIVVAVALLVVLNAAVTEWRRRRRTWSSFFTELLSVLAVNVVIVGLFPDFLLRDGLPDQDPLFFVVLISLLSTMFDRGIDTRPEPDEPVHPWREARTQWIARHTR